MRDFRNKSLDSVEKVMEPIAYLQFHDELDAFLKHKNASSPTC